MIFLDEKKQFFSSTQFYWCFEFSHRGMRFIVHNKLVENDVCG